MQTAISALTVRRTQLVLKGVEINGGFPGCDNQAPGIGVSLNDHLYEIQDHPGEWREGFVIEQMYTHDMYGECLYLSPQPRRRAS